MDIFRFREIFDSFVVRDTKPTLSDSLMVLCKYVKTPIQGAEHDNVFGPSIDTLCCKGITEWEVKTLKLAGWRIVDRWLELYV